MTSDYLFITNGVESYQNPELNEELCGYYANLKTHTSKVYNGSLDTTSVRMKSEWSDGPKRKSCKHCNGRGYQNFTGHGLASIKACRCIEDYLSVAEGLETEHQESANPLEFLS